MKLNFSLVLLFIAQISFGQNGVEMIMEQKLFAADGKNIEDQRSTTIWLTEDQLKVSSNDIQEPVMIFDASKEELTLIFRDKKEYTSISKEELIEINAKLEEAKKMMEERLDQLPEAQRQMMKAQMDKMYAQEAQKVSYELSEENIKLGAHMTDKYNGVMENVLVEEIYLAPSSDFDVDEKSFSVYLDMTEFMREYMSSLFNSMGNSSETAIISEDHPAFQKGIPVKTISYDEQNISSEEVLVALKEKDIPSEAFEPTPGYKRFDLLQRMQSGR